jgi:hypothetical protein
LRAGDIRRAIQTFHTGMAIQCGKVCIAQRISLACNFDAFYIFTITFSKSLARNFQTFQSGWQLLINLFYYLFKKFLVSDWLTANCEIVISTQWLTKSGFFTFILAK